MDPNPIWPASFREEKMDTNAQRGKSVREHREKMALCKTKREASEETTPADTLMADFQPP